MVTADGKKQRFLPAGRIIEETSHWCTSVRALASILYMHAADEEELTGACISRWRLCGICIGSIIGYMKYFITSELINKSAGCIGRDG